MRVITLTLCLLIAGPALAAPAASLRVVGPDADGLRGSQSVSSAASSSTPASAPTETPLPPPIQSKAPLAFFASDAQPAARDVDQCRQGCAQAYYFCLAGSDAQGCPETWTSCRSDCSRDSRPLP